MQTGWGGDVTPRGLSPSGRPFDKIRNLCWPCNVEGGGSRRAPVAQGAGPSPASDPRLSSPPTGHPVLRGSALILTEAGDLTNLELSWMLQACKMEGFPLVPPVSTGASLPAQPGALGCLTVCLPTNPPAYPLPSGSLSVGSRYFLPGAAGLRPSEGPLASLEHALAG